MTFCAQCSAQLSTGARFCSNCGAATALSPVPQWQFNNRPAVQILGIWAGFVGPGTVGKVGVFTTTRIVSRRYYVDFQLGDDSNQPTVAGGTLLLSIYLSQMDAGAFTTQLASQRIRVNIDQKDWLYGTTGQPYWRFESRSEVKVRVEHLYNPSFQIDARFRPSGAKKDIFKLAEIRADVQRY